ncbi:MAG TPA: hypothetical protein DDZ80_08645 [Cyanobacteria bacterium UBA8803]|nr:hypothetical protein [Cyanobacteria bacterium UBA9273]HBL58569.1 hypothetical protein [Cyanobacteria bacterium UBA8803]
MSQDQQKQQAPNNDEPNSGEPVTPVEGAKGSEETRSTLKVRRKQELPFIKAQTVKVLRGIIWLLERIVETLETAPITKPIPTPPEPTAASKSIVDSTTVGTEPALGKTRGEFVPQPSRVEAVLAFWQGLLRKIRSLLPTAWNNKLSDWGLTGAIAGIVAVVFLTVVALRPKPPVQVAQDVSPEPPVEVIEVPPTIEASPTIETSPKIDETPPQIEASPTIETPPELPAPEPEPPTETAEPPAPEPPPLELTPEQSLIAGIQNQVAEITEQYANGLIKSIQANFRGSRLLITVTNSWYELDEQQQDRLADEILGRSTELDFSKLEIVNSEGTLLARSPVVGTHMVILRRQALSESL